MGKKRTTTTTTIIRGGGWKSKKSSIATPSLRDRTRCPADEAIYKLHQCDVGVLEPKRGLPRHGYVWLRTEYTVTRKHPSGYPSDIRASHLTHERLPRITGHLKKGGRMDTLRTIVTLEITAREKRKDIFCEMFWERGDVLLHVACCECARYKPWCECIIQCACYRRAQASWFCESRVVRTMKAIEQVTLGTAEDVMRHFEEGPTKCALRVYHRYTRWVCFVLVVLDMFSF